MTTGRALDREAAPQHALEVRCWDGALACTVRLHVTVADVNDHTPVFTQRFYDLRVPAPLHRPQDPFVDALPQVRIVLKSLRRVVRARLRGL